MTDKPEIQPAWFVWAAGSKGPRPRILFQDIDPMSKAGRGPDDRAYGPVYLSAHKITGELLERVNNSEGGCCWEALTQMFPAPKMEDA